MAFAWPYSAASTDANRTALPATLERFQSIRSPVRAVPRLHHNDFRPDNMMFGPEAVTTWDWQSFAFGSGAQDVAYFLAGGILPYVLDQLIAQTPQTRTIPETRA